MLYQHQHTARCIDSMNGVKCKMSLFSMENFVVTSKKKKTETGLDHWKFFSWEQKSTSAYDNFLEEHRITEFGYFSVELNQANADFRRKTDTKKTTTTQIEPILNKQQFDSFISRIFSMFFCVIICHVQR